MLEWQVFLSPTLSIDSCSPRITSYRDGSLVQAMQIFAELKADLCAATPCSTISPEDFPRMKAASLSKESIIVSALPEIAACDPNHVAPLQ